MQTFVSNLGFTFFFPDAYQPVNRPLRWRAQLSRAVQGESYWLKRAIKSTSLLVAAKAADKSVLRLAVMPLKKLGAVPEQAEVERVLSQIALSSKKAVISNESTKTFRLEGNLFVRKMLDRAPATHPGRIRRITYAFAILEGELVVWFHSAASAEALKTIRESRIQFRNSAMLPLFCD